MSEESRETAAVRRILAGVVADPARVQALSPQADLFDSLPELDSVACVNVVLALEARFDIEVADEDVTEALFESIASLSRYVRDRIGSPSDRSSANDAGPID